MKGRGLAILFVIFITLAGVVYLQDQGMFDNTSDVIPTPAFTRVYPELAVLDINAIQLSFPGTDRSATFAREPNGTWIWLEADQAIDPEIGTNVARTIVLLPYTRTVPLPTDGDLTQFGFNETSQFLISVLTTNNGQLSIAIGDPLQTGPEFYAIVDDREEIYVLQRFPIDFLASILRDPQEENGEDSTFNSP